jgi:UbiD family decarboxylase
MPFASSLDDLSQWIALLEKRDQLIRIKAPVSPILEITEMAIKRSYLKTPPVVLFRC